METFRIKRKNAIPLSSAIRDYLKEAHLTSGINTRCIFAAWDEVSGTAPFTIKRFYRNGKLYITFNSSVVRDQMKPRKELLIEKINDRLAKDPFFSTDEHYVSWVEDIVLK
ncbi:MAG: DUF721 domain-containing protein [Bacteroidales bacterium]|nr:DUF721 domain-containing protein [Bacteroidales bacterium]